MIFLCIILMLFIRTLSASPTVNLRNGRIIGGSVVSIQNYPHMAALLLGPDNVNFRHSCGGSIVNQRHIITAAHCVIGFGSPQMHRMRVGSTMSNSGGDVYNTERITGHPNYNPRTMDSDIAIMRTTSFINYNSNVQPGSFAGPNYDVPDNDSVWAAGWGRIDPQTAQFSEELRHVQIWTINQNLCSQIARNFLINDNMICAGAINTGGAGQCSGDSGGPLYHEGTIVGVCSFGGGLFCGAADTPSVNVRVSRFILWIQANSQ